MGTSQWHGKKVLGEERWSRTYEVDGGVAVNVSKFVTDDIAISVDDIKNEWTSWSSSERIAFAHAFSQKPKFSPEEEQVLDFLMLVDDERVWCSIVSGLPGHSQKSRVLDFLIDRLKSGSEPKANYVHALGTLGGAVAVRALKDLHDRLARGIAAPGGESDKTMIFDFVVCSSLLAKLEGSIAYQDEIRRFLDHPDKHVQAFSRVYLQGGPPQRRF